MHEKNWNGKIEKTQGEKGKHILVYLRKHLSVIQTATTTTATIIIIGRANTGHGVS